ncbi:MAG: type III polyketide synthase, partial [Planctomycetales bacterium]
ARFSTTILITSSQMGLSITGIGTAVPGDSISQQDSLEIAQRLVGDDPEQREMLKKLYPNTRIAQRYSVVDSKLVSAVLGNGPVALQVVKKLCADGGPSTVARLQVAEDAAGALAEEAAKQALREAGCDPQEVTHLITASSTVGTAPGFDAELIRRLGLPETVARTNIGMMMCQAALSGLRVANSFATADPSAVILMCVLEICSAHYDLDPQPKKLVSNAIFADGAAALVGTGSPADDWQVDRSGGCLLGKTSGSLRVAFGDHGLDIRLTTKVPRIIEQHLRSLIDSWLGESGLDTTQIKSWAVHPGGPRILEATARALQLSDHDLAASWSILEQFGNMSSPTVLFILDKLRRENAPLPCVAIAFGPGMTVELTLLQPAGSKELSKAG